MKLQRMLAIVLLLLRHERMTGRELASRFEVSLRTIYRDLEAIAEAGVPVSCLPGKGGGILIQPRYKVEKGLFSTEDISRILFGLGILSHSLNDLQVEDLLERIRQFAPDADRDEIERKLDQTQFDPSAWIGPDASEETLALVRKALGQRRRLTFHYVNRTGEACLDAVEPVRLLFKDGNWYLQAYVAAENRQAEQVHSEAGLRGPAQDGTPLRLFKLRRMFRVGLLNTTYIWRTAPHPFAGFVDGMSRRTIAVELLAEVSAMDVLLDWCSMQDVERQPDGRYRVHLAWVDDTHGYAMLMGLGDRITCLSPQHVRDGLRARFLAAAGKYAP